MGASCAGSQSESAQNTADSLARVDSINRVDSIAKAEQEKIRLDSVEAARKDSLAQDDRNEQWATAFISKCNSAKSKAMRQGGSTQLNNQYQKLHKELSAKEKELSKKQAQRCRSALKQFGQYIMG